LSSQFINAVHARLYLRGQLGLDQNQTPVESLDAILNSFDEKMQLIYNIFNGDTSGEGSLTETIKSSLQMMFSGLVQTYLRNNLSEHEKARILSVIERVINLELQPDFLLLQFVSDLKLDLVTKLSGDLLALTTSHKEDVFNLLGRDERDIHDVEDKITQLELFKTHLEVLQVYFGKFESVQTQLTENKEILVDCLAHLASRRDALMKDRERYGMINEELKSVRTELRAATQNFEAELCVQVERNRLLSTDKKQLQEENSRFKIKNAQRRLDNRELLEENTQAIKLAEFLQKDNARLQGKYALLEAQKVVIQKENTRIYQELAVSNAALTYNQQRVAELEASLEAQVEANRVLQVEKAILESERDMLRVNLDDRDAQLAKKNLRIDDLEDILENPDSDALFQGLNLEILGGFALVLGVAVVAIALTALILTPVAPLVPVGIALAGAGLATAGFFGMKQGVQEQHQEALHERTLEASV